MTKKLQLTPAWLDELNEERHRQAMIENRLRRDIELLEAHHRVDVAKLRRSALLGGPK